MQKVFWFLALALFGAVGFAQEAAEAAGASDGLRTGLVAVGMGLALGLGAIGTGIAQSAIGAAALGSVVEDRRNFGTALIFFLIPETLVIFGLVGFFLLQGQLKTLDWAFVLGSIWFGPGTLTKSRLRGE